MTKHKRVIEGWVVTPGAGGAFDYGFHCHVCDMHVERLTFEEARGVAGAHLHRVEVGCPFCRDGLSAREMVDRGLTLCGPCHGRLSELLAPAEGMDEQYRELTEDEERAEELTWD